MSAPVVADPDAERLRALRRMKALALSLLVVAAIIYAATVALDHSGVWGWVNSGAEAAMVGAMADWFAVTALFRHPLGIPIPHTAIVPTKKDEIAVNLQDFFTENFLTPEIAKERIESAHVALRVGEWLADEDHASRVAGELARVLRAGVGRVGDDDVRSLVTDTLVPRLAREPMAGLAGDMLDAVVREGAHKSFVDLVAREVQGWLQRHPESFKRMVADRAPWWSPDAISRRLVDWTYNQAVAWVDEILNEPDHPTRKSVDDLLLKMSSDLRYDIGVQRRFEALKARLLTNPQLGDTAVSLWRSSQEVLSGALDDPDSALRRRVTTALMDIGHALVEDPEQRQRLEDRLEEFISFFIKTYGRELSGVISHTIQRWDGQEASRKIELHVGRDLQFIRLNGTIVGCLVGLLIHGLTVLLS